MPCYSRGHSSTGGEELEGASAGPGELSFAPECAFQVQIAARLLAHGVS